MTRFIAFTTLFSVSATGAFAASGPFFSFNNTDFVVLLGFLLFIGVLIYFGAFKTIRGLLDDRADGIRKELDEARGLREDAQKILASYSRKQAEVKTEADAIVARAKEDATLAAEAAKADLQKSLERRMAAAEDQIKAAEASAVSEVRNRAVEVAVAAAKDVISKSLGAKDAGALIDTAISDVDARLN